jgi:hypothetical protein
MCVSWSKVTWTFFKFCLILTKDSIAIIGRARIEQQKQTALTNIQKSKNATLKQLDIEYASADKAKTSFGYIGITFLGVLFGSIFGNDFIKLCIYYFRELRQRRRNIIIHNNNQRDIDEEVEHQVQIEMDRIHLDDLEARLEMVYVKLKKANAIAKRNNETRLT